MIWQWGQIQRPRMRSFFTLLRQRDAGREHAHEARLEHAAREARAQGEAQALAARQGNDDGQE